jgi:hypothetical protein
VIGITWVTSELTEVTKRKRQLWLGLQGCHYCLLTAVTGVISGVTEVTGLTPGLTEVSGVTPEVTEVTEMTPIVAEETKLKPVVTEGAHQWYTYVLR